MMLEERENEVGEELFVEVAKTAANVEITTILPRMPETLQIEREVVQLSDEDSSVENVVVQNELNVMRNNMYVTSLERICRVETLEKEYRTTETSLSREALVKHFGKQLEDAADNLGVSRSTMKRACRVHSIKKWPFPKRKKFKPPPSSLKHVNGFVQGVDE